MNVKVDVARPGDRVEVTGILRAAPVRLVSRNAFFLLEITHSILESRGIKEHLNQSTEPIWMFYISAVLTKSRIFVFDDPDATY